MAKQTNLERWQKFVAAILLDPEANVERAYAKAGYKPHQQAASRLYNRPEIQRMLAEARSERAERTKIDADKLLVQLDAEAFADMAELYDENMQLRPIKDWPLIWRQGLVAGIEVEELFEGRGAERVSIGFVRKVKLADRTRIKELLGKHVGVQAFKEKVEHEAGGSLLDLITKSMQPRD